MAFNTQANKPSLAPKGVGAIQTAGTTTNAKGAYAFSRTPKSELFLLAVGRFFGKDTFYESALKGEERLLQLTHQVAVEDPAWLLGFVGWLRESGYIRTAAMVIGLEGAKAVLDITSSKVYRQSPTLSKSLIVDYAGGGFARKLASAGIQRGDEPGEAAAYWASRYGNVTMKGGRASAPKFPQPIKRGIGDGLKRVVTERAVLKYDTDSRQFGYADLIQLCHPTPKDYKQNALFKYLLDRQYNKAAEVPEALKTITANKAVRAADGNLADQSAATLKQAGVSWQNIGSQGAMTAKEWEAAIPGMGYMALLKNLRNFDQAGISASVANTVAAKLMDPAEVARSMQFPLRFLTAFVAAPSMRWSYPLAVALDLSLRRVPTLTGRTLVLIDTSGSMNTVWNGDDDRESTVTRPKFWDAAALFGIALAMRSPGVELYSYSSGGRYWQGITKRFPIRQGAEALKELKRWQDEGFNGGGGTPTVQALQSTFNGQDRVIIITDEQHDYSGYSGSVSSTIPASVPLFTFNIAGYKAGQTASAENRYTFAGLNDQAFRMISWVADAAAQTWPWERAA
jgi:TROVE domain